jgi:hypothetical protein
MTITKPDSLSIAAVATANSSKEIRMSPNPASTSVRFSFPNSDAAKYHIAIHDMLGNAVISSDITTENELDIHSLSAGVYAVTITGGSERWTTKLVKL